MDTPTDAPEASWGAKINTDRTRHGGNRRKLLDDCPTWADKRQQEKWSELGLIIWDHDKQALIRLHPVHALAVLEELRTTTVWQDIGFTIGEPMIAYTPAVPTSAPPTGKRASRTTTMTASIDAPVSLPHMGSTVLTNPLPLSTVQSQHLLAFLHTHEVELRAMADAAQQRYIKTISSIQDMLLDTIPEQETTRVDLAARPFSWSKHRLEKLTWICDVPPNRATIWFAHTNNAWRGCIERPHQYKQDKWFLPSFDAALTWAEDELRAADATVLPPPPTPLSLATLTPAHRQRLMPYWIDPQALEPAQLTYQAVLLLTHVPIRQKGSELSFGERSYHPHDYPTVRELTKRLNLAMQAVDVRVQPGSIYAVTSLTTYMQMQTATEQAQQLWNTVAATLRSGTITGAVYGVKEIQTQFCAWIGGYGIWPVAASDRAQEMAARAFDLTLIYALDVDGYRATEPKLFTGLNDDELLEYLHVQRTRSAYIPVVARTESEQWLRDQGHPDLIDYVDPLSRKAQHRSKEHNRKYQALVAESREWLSQHAPKQTRTH